jgi:archaemetzincin
MRMKTLQLVAVGSAPGALLKELEEPLQKQLGVQCIPGKVALSAPSYAFNKDRQQYHSSAILRRLAALGNNSESVLGMVDVDLFVPDSSYVFGDADRECHAAVLSVLRLRQGAEGELVRRRIQIEGLHQAGHLVGLSYCEDSKCAMFLATTAAETDRKQPALCHICRNELSKLLR